jgi:GT2 family glycosyltransferase
MKLKIEKSVVVITPTIGLPDLTKAVESVRSQSYKNIKHLLVVDGPEYYDKVNQLMSKNEEAFEYTITTCTPTNVGGNGFYGHRVYAAYPHLVNEDYVLFLDEDNWWDHDHVTTLVDKIETDGLEWAHSLRKVYIHPEKLLAYDNCESIGRWPIWFTKDKTEQFLVDTSSYCFKREFLIQVCNLWHWGWGGDRRFFMLIKNMAKFDTTGMHTLNYRLPDMEKAYGGDYSFFEKGNAEMFKQYGGGYPWLSKI